MIECLKIITDTQSREIESGYDPRRKKMGALQRP